MWATSEAEAEGAAASGKGHGYCLAQAWKEGQGLAIPKVPSLKHTGLERPARPQGQSSPDVLTTHTGQERQECKLHTMVTEKPRGASVWHLGSSIPGLRDRAGEAAVVAWGWVGRVARPGWAGMAG